MTTAAPTRQPTSSAQWDLWSVVPWASLFWCWCYARHAKYTTVRLVVGANDGVVADWTHDSETRNDRALRELGREEQHFQDDVEYSASESDHLARHPADEEKKDRPGKPTAVGRSVLDEPNAFLCVAKA